MVSLLTDTEIWELLKIFIDKGLLALIVVLVAAKYGSALKKGEEITKVVLPRILELTSRAEELYLAGEKTLTELQAQFAGFEEWARAIASTPAVCVPLSNAFPKVSDQLPSLDHPQWGRISVSEFLVITAPDELVLSTARNPNFLTLPAQYDEGGFLRTATGMLFAPAKSREFENDYATIRHAVSRSVFETLVTGPRIAYRDAIREFRLTLMRNCPTKLDRRGRKSVRNIMCVLSTLQDIISRHPTPELITANGERVQPAHERILECHAALISQLGAILRSA